MTFSDRTRSRRLTRKQRDALGNFFGRCHDEDLYPTFESPQPYDNQIDWLSFVLGEELFQQVVDRLVRFYTEDVDGKENSKKQ